MWRKQEAPQPSSTESGGAVTPGGKGVVSAPVQGESQFAAGILTSAFVMKGKISAGEAEDLFVDGQVQGSIDLNGGTVTVGANGHVTAEIAAREIMVHGRVNGNLLADERIQVSATGQVVGDIATPRILVEDGAILRGRLEVRLPPSAGEGRPIDIKANRPAQGTARAQSSHS